MTLPNDIESLIGTLYRNLDGRAALIGRFEQYYEGTQPGTWLSPESQTALKGRLPQLSLNLCRLSIASLVERLAVIGFTVDDAEDADPTLAATWRASGFDFESDLVHTTSMVTGMSYVLAWTDPETGAPWLSAEHPAQCVVRRDPVTRRPTVALKRWTDVADPDTGAGTQFCTLYTRDEIRTYATKTDQPGGGVFSPFGGGYLLHSRTVNPLGVIPITEFRNGYSRSILTSLDGNSELNDLASIVDAINKLGQDMMVSSELAAFPRRTATGLQLQEDPDTGEVVSPFESDATRVWIAEDPEVRIGQLPSADLSPYTVAMSALVEKASAVAALPAHYLGVLSSQPPSADGIKAAESSLTSRAESKIRQYGPQWERVGALVKAIETGRSFDAINVRALWASPETRTENAAADSAAKLAALGVPVEIVLGKVLGWTPDEIQAVRDAQGRQAAQANVSALLHPTPVEPTRDLGQAA